ncbi:MAG: putative actin patch assembly and actin polymerization protein [Geoglossum umbratile]|nr:MAG: putative actin patch assembly and actin polymerization protein [Geoglossum umbratile]
MLYGLLSLVKLFVGSGFFFGTLLSIFLLLDVSTRGYLSRLPGLSGRGNCMSISGSAHGRQDELLLSPDETHFVKTKHANSLSVYDTSFDICDPVNKSIRTGARMQPALLAAGASARNKKPYTAITVQIERLTGEQYEENDIGGIVDLIEVIRIQDTGPTEAARAIRKKLKYGNVHRQLRALAILDGLIQNAGPRFQRTFADEPLLERLRVAATDPVSDPDVRAKCKVLFGQWSVAYKTTPGMGAIAALYQQLPQRKKPTQQQQSRVLKETADDADPRLGHSVSVASGGGPARPLNSATSPTSSSSKPISLSAGPDLTGSLKSKSKNKKDRNKVKPFNLEKEKSQLLQTLASASVASTNLLNALKLINRENERVSENAEAVKRFETCKALRRQILRYIQNVESEQWLGGLIHANEELVNALMAFEALDKSVEDDSDSEEDGPTARTQRTSSPPTRGFAGLVLDDRPAKPPRPGANIPKPAFAHGNGKGRQYSDNESEPEQEEEEEEEDENDPFADRNAVETPFVEREGVTWKEV